MPLLQPDRDAEQGLLFIPGLTLSFVPIADLIRRDLVVPTHLAYPGAAEIWIDWVRFWHDLLESLVPTASPLPCDTPNRQPHLDIRVTAGSTPDGGRGRHADTLASRATTATGFRSIRSGREAGRAISAARATGSAWSAGRTEGSGFRACGRRAAHSRGRRSTGAAALPRWEPCPEGPGRRRGRGLLGHMNYGPATYTGKISTVRCGVNIARDGDAEFFSGAGRRRARHRAAGRNQVPRADRSRVLDGRERSAGFARRGGGGSRSGT